MMIMPYIDLLVQDSIVESLMFCANERFKPFKIHQRLAYQYARNSALRA